MKQMCPHCGTEVHVDDTQAPPYAFNVDCPRCRKSVTMTPPPKQEPTLKGDAGAARTQMMGAPPAPARTAGGGAVPPADMMQTFMQMMATMAAGAAAPKGTESLVGKAFAWQRKHVMVCCAEPAQRTTIERVLEKANYEITLPQTSAQSIEVMHDF